MVKFKKGKVMSNDNEYGSFFVKAALYITGIVLGLVAKLAYINKERKLTVKDFILHGSIAFACAWLVWALLSYYGHLDLANIASVIVGRYGDWLLFAIFKAVKNVINNMKL